jgi:hypothetical protein
VLARPWQKGRVGATSEICREADHNPWRGFAPLGLIRLLCNQLCLTQAHKCRAIHRGVGMAVTKASPPSVALTFPAVNFTSVQHTSRHKGAAPSSNGSELDLALDWPRNYLDPC